ncbi:Thioredoxin-like 3-2, chloroplastic [Ananas comosus]|uniref:Thioredoxin-like 3-2, chloroplastic n=1 Tax=Ananas comosus TaxID=4615 RepID=A0A199VFI5_ANACO|nr:Thioredoxin-like 3-2, chloroplastic [Ananas comosus]
MSDALLASSAAAAALRLRLRRLAPPPRRLSSTPLLPHRTLLFDPNKPSPSSSSSASLYPSRGLRSIAAAASARSEAAPAPAPEKNLGGGEDDAPASIELVPIVSEAQFDRIVAEAHQLEESIVVDGKLVQKIIRFYSVDVNTVPQRLVNCAGITLWNSSKKQAEVIGGHKAWLVIDEVREMIDNEDESHVILLSFAAVRHLCIFFVPSFPSYFEDISIMHSILSQCSLGDGTLLIKTQSDKVQRSSVPRHKNGPIRLADDDGCQKELSWVTSIIHLRKDDEDSSIHAFDCGGSRYCDYKFWELTLPWINVEHVCPYTKKLIIGTSLKCNKMNLLKCAVFCGKALCDHDMVTRLQD